MALSGNTVWEVETVGSDTLNGGAFDPSQTAGMFTDGAATVATSTAPVFTSASYNFVAGDVGAWLYIAAGTNWLAGWYKIASVASNAATLNATIGQAVLKAYALSTVAGCATTASPTAATWTIDYSQQSAAQFTYTDLVSAGTGLTVSSAAHPFAKQQVGNSIVVTGGTNFNTGRYVVASIGALNVATVVGPTNITTGAGAAGTGGLGGALASLGQVGSVLVTSNLTFIKAGTYSVTSASTNVAAGCFSKANNNLSIQGYQTVREDFGTPPLIQASGISTFALLAMSGSISLVQNLIFDGAGLASSQGVVATGAAQVFYSIATINCTNGGYTSSGAGSVTTVLILGRATGCSTVAALNGVSFYDCEAYSNTFTGFSLSANGVARRCLSYNNSGATSDGFISVSSAIYENCSAYGNGRDGFRASASATTSSVWLNCIAEANTGFGFNGSAQFCRLFICAAFNNTGGATSLAAAFGACNIGFITGTASFFVNPGAGNLALNNTTGGGALARAAGIPGPFLAGTTTSFLDLGGAQHQDSPATNTYILAKRTILEEQEEFTPRPSRASVIYNAANYIFSRRVEFPSDDMPVEQPRRAPVIISEVPSIFVRRSSTVEEEEPWQFPRRVSISVASTNVSIRRPVIEEAELPWANSRPPVLYAPISTTVNVSVKRPTLTEDGLAFSAPRRNNVFISSTNTVVNISVRRPALPEEEADFVVPRRSNLFTLASPAVTLIVNRVNHLYLYEEA